MSKILAIDDEKNSLILIKSILKKSISHCEVITVQSGIEGIEKAKKENPDTILLDIQMPHIDGFEVCKRLKSDEKTKNIPIIFLTGFETKSKSRIKGLELGADAFLTKPIDEAELISQVNVMLRIKKNEDKIRNEKKLLDDLVRERTSELQSSENRLNDIFENMMSGIVINKLILDKNGKPVNYILEKMNKAAEKILSWNRKDIEGKKATEVYKGDTPFIERYARVAQTGKAEYFITYYPGFKKWFEITSFCPKKGYFANIFKDITEQKLAKENLKLSDERYHALLKSSSEGIWCFEVEPIPINLNEDEIIKRIYKTGTLVECNDVMAKMYAYKSKEDIIGVKLEKLLVPSDRRNIIYLKNFIRNNFSIIDGESYEPDLNGNIHIYLNNFSANIENGYIVRAWGTQRDITERKRTEEKIKHLNLVLQSVRNVNQLITKEKDSNRLIQRICDMLIETSGYNSAWIILFDKNKNFITSAESGLAAEVFLPLKELFKRGELIECARRALKQSGIITVKDSPACVGCPLLGKAPEEKQITARLEYKGKIFGLISASMAAGFINNIEEHKLFKEVTNDIAFALYRIELEEKQKIAQRKLKESENKYRYLFEQSQVINLIMGIDGKIIDINEKGIKIFGYKKEELIGKPLIEFIVPEHRKKIAKQLTQYLQGKQAPSLEVNFIGKKDTYTLLFGEGNTMLFEKEQPIGFLISALNITERKRMEEELLIEKVYFEKLFQNSPEAIVIADNDSKLLRINRKFTKLFGYAMDEVKGINIDNLIASKDYQEEADSITKQIAKGKTIKYETIRQRKDGTPVNVSILGTPIKIDKEQKAVYGIYRDITERKLAEEKQKKLEEREHSILQAIPDAVIGMHERHIVFANKGVEYVFGWKPEELINKSTRILYRSDEDYDKIAQLFFPTLEKKATYIKEFPCSCKDGRDIICRVSASRLGEKLIERNIVATFTDITERKKNENEIKEKSRELEILNKIIKQANESKDLYSLLENILSYTLNFMDFESGGIYLIDNINNKQAVLKCIKELPQDYINEVKTIKIDREPYYSVFKEAKAFFTDKYKELRPEHYIKWGFLSFASIALLSKEKLIGIMNIISKKKLYFTETQKKILQSIGQEAGTSIAKMQAEKNFLQSNFIVSSSQNRIAIIDKNYVYQFVNDAFLKSHLKTKEQIIGHNVSEILGEEQFENIVKDKYDKCFTGKVVHFQEWFNFPEKKNVYLHEDIYPFIENNTISGLVLITYDITKLKKTEENLEKAKEKAEESDRLKTAFLSNMSHEIRTPMNAIIGFSNLLSDTDITNDERKEFIELIDSNSNSLMNLIEDIIDISKIEAGQLIIKKTKTPVNKIFSELYNSFNQIKNEKDKTNIELRLNLANKEKDFTIITDPHRFKQILSNLLDNAVKFTEKGFIEFGYSINNQSYLQFYVKDTGIGIPNDKMNIIFDRFRQVDGSNTRKYGGTGLGLAISKNLVELLGGKMWLESQIDKGTTFYFTLPYNPAEKAVEKTQIITKHKKKYIWNNKIILIAEDTVSNYQFLEAALRKTKANLLWAQDGKEAVDMCKANDKINLILMDIQMPVLNGYKAARQIRQFRKDLPIIAETAFAMSGDREKSLEAGCDDYIAKPIKIAELLEKIDKWLK